MSSIADVTYGKDELDAANFKPWWEIGVSYGNRILFAYCFIAMFLIDSQGVQAKCIPMDVNTTSIFKRAEFVDSECFYQLPGGVLYPGANALILFIAAYVLHTGWTATRAVRNAFHALARVERLLDENKIAKEDLPTHSKEVEPECEDPTIKYAMKYLSLHINFNGCSLPVIYIAAMIVRLLVFIVEVYFIASNYFFVAAKRLRSFDCIITYYGVKEEFYCSSYIGLTGLFCGLFIICLTFLILVCSGYGAGVAISIQCSCYCCFWKRSHDASVTPEGRNLLFIRRFFESSTTVSPALMELINRVARMQMRTVQRLVRASAGIDSPDDKGPVH